MKRTVQLSEGELNEALKSKKVRFGTWSNPQNKGHALSLVRKEIGADADPERWYEVTQDLLYGMGLRGLLSNRYNCSPQAFLKSTMPSDEWAKLLPWKFKSAPKKFWSDEDNHGLALEAVRKHIGADAELEKWYEVTQDLLHGMGLNGLLVSHYNGSPQAFLKSTMPSDEWAKLLPWKFKSGVPLNFWSDRANHGPALEAVRKHIGADAELERWYGVTKGLLYGMGLGGLLVSHYSHSPQAFLETNMPSDEWAKLLPWKFKSGVPQNFWSDRANHGLALEAVRKHIGADADPERWYGVTQDLLHGMGLGGLLVHYYHDSPQAFLKSTMPSDEWAKLLPWKFKSGVPQNFWSDPANHGLALEAVRKHIGADADPERWYGVTANLLYGMSLGGLVHYYNSSPQAFLKSNMPSDEWAKLDATKFGIASAQELWAIWEVNEREDFLLLGADAVDRSRVTFGKRRFRWDLIVLHIPTQRVGVLEIDGEQHFFRPDWEATNERDKAKRDSILSDLPPCAERIDFLARISYSLRPKGRAAIKDLLDLVCQTLSSCDPPLLFICLPQDSLLYTERGVPKLCEAA